MYYILDDDKKVVKVDFMAYTMWYERVWKEHHQMFLQVAYTRVASWHVSTIFTGMASMLIPRPAPLVFETGVFVTIDEMRTYKCATWNEAVARHQTMVKVLERRFKVAGIDNP